MLPIVGEAIAGTARAILDRVLPDPAKRAEAEIELRKIEAAGTFADRAALQIAQAQSANNLAEAGTDLFRGGWRPFIGWVCGSAMAVQFVAGPLLEWGAAAAGHPVPPVPKLDAVLWELLFGMLGLGTLRTVEKIKGKA